MGLMSLNVANRQKLIALHLLFYGAFLTVRSAFWDMPTFFTLVFAALLIWVSVVDCERMEIPDTASATIFVSGGLYSWVSGVDLATRFWGAMMWAALFYGVGIIYLRLRGQDGLGFGDVKLIAGLAMWLGFADTNFAVLSAALCGVAMIVVTQQAQSRSFENIAQTAVAFGPFLCLSAWANWLF